MHVRARNCKASAANLDAPLAAVNASGIDATTSVLYFASELGEHPDIMRRLRSTFRAVVTLLDVVAPGPLQRPLGRVLPLPALSAVNAVVCAAADVFIGGDDGYSSFDAYVHFDRVLRGARVTSYVGYDSAHQDTEC